MPIFDFVCDKCGKELDDEFIHNESYIPKCCKEKMRKKIGIYHFGFPEFGITLNNVESKPVHFNSRQELINYKRKHNLQLGALPYDS